MIGQWIRIDDPLLTDELGWHRVEDVIEPKGDLERRVRVELVCHVAIVVDPKKVHRGLPMAGNVVCPGCMGVKEAVA